MKQSIVMVLFAVLVCSITQPGFAADFTFKIAGVQIKKLPTDVEKVKIYCLLRYQLPGGVGVSIIDKSKELPITQTTDGRGVISGPFEFVFDNVIQRNSVYRGECYLMNFKSGSWLIAEVCDPASAAGKVCVDAGVFNRSVSAQALN